MRKVYVGLTVVALAIALAGCSDSSHDSHVSSDKSTSEQPTSSSAATSSGLATIDVSQTIKDDELGDTFKALSVVRNFPIPDRYPAIKGSKELVLVKFTLSVGTKYYHALGGSNFNLVSDGGGFTSGTTIVNAEMAKAGYQPLPDAGVQRGQTATGWAAFTVTPLGSKTLTLRYKRLAATVIGSHQPIPEKIFEVPLIK